MEDHRRFLIEHDERAVADLIRSARRVAVLGIKPETRAMKPAHYVPAYLAAAGLEVIPVPVYYPEVTHILGYPVYRRVRDVPGPPGSIDIVDVFRSSPDVAAHLEDLLAARPRAVWLQLGIRDDAVAETLARAGILVVQDRCLMVAHQRYAR
jgi:predicted CoA-binding protein